MKTSGVFVYFWYLIAIVCIFILFGCTPLRDLKYMQDIEKELPDTLKVHKEIYKLNIGDVLFIDVATSNFEFRKFITPERTGTGGRMTDPLSLYIYGYQIDEDGYIHVPFIKPLKAVGKTVKDVQEELQVLLSAYLTDVSVNVKLVNFQVTVIGEVSRPGQYFATSDRMNLYEALGMAGDLTIYGDRKSVKVMRMLPDGNYELHELDIRSREVISDLYFNLQPNDIIYVEPLGTRPFGLGTLTLGTMFSAVTTILVIINFFR